MLPVEVIENILSKCDGKTLLNARKVNEQWKCMVDYLTRKTPIWFSCCHKDIPRKELLEYLQNYKEDDPHKWLHIYINWYSWEDIGSVVTDIILSPVEIPRISCIAVSGDFIAVGSQDGRLRIFTSSWNKVYSARIFAVRINSVAFIEGEQSENGYTICLVISFQKGLHIFCLNRHNKAELIIQDVKSHSIYKNFICYEKFGGRMTIAKLNGVHGRKELAEIWFSRIYSPSSLSCMKMWDGVCTFLVNNEVKIIEYESPDVTPMDCMKKKARIKFNFPLVDSQNTQILRDDIIISLCKNDEDVKCDFIEVFLLTENEKYSKKMFNTWEIFRSYITCICLYGNTLILGMDAGTVYFYRVSCWKNLDIREYSHRLIIGKHPITCIAVKETPSERRIYVSSKFSIHEIPGFLPNVY